MKKYSRHDDNLAFKARTGQLKGKLAGGRTTAAQVATALGNRPQRKAGITLVPADIPVLVQDALAAGGPIRQEDDFEHFLVVTNDNMRFYTYHFIIAPGLGDPRRAVLLSGRVVHGNVLEAERYTHQLARYVRALGTPRLAIDLLSFCSYLPALLKQILPDQPWRDISMGGPVYGDDAQAKHRDCNTLALERFTLAQQAGTIRHPFERTVGELISNTRQRRDPAGRLFLDGISEYGMHPDLTALLAVYMDEEFDRGGYPWYAPSPRL